MRTSLYKKPKLRLKTIELQQPELGLKIEETDPSGPLIELELTKGNDCDSRCHSLVPPHADP